MVYIHSWQEFQDAAEALYEKSPYKVSKEDCSDFLSDFFHRHGTV